MGGLYDREKHTWKVIEDVTLAAACGPPGGARQHMSPRCSRHFLTLLVPPPSESVLRSIFETAAAGFFAKHFPSDIAMSALKSTVAATTELFASVSAKLLPTPFKPQYTFNLRDLSKIFQARNPHTRALRTFAGNLPCALHTW